MNACGDICPCEDAALSTQSDLDLDEDLREDASVPVRTAGPQKEGIYVRKGPQQGTQMHAHTQKHTHKCFQAFKVIGFVGFEETGVGAVVVIETHNHV